MFCNHGDGRLSHRFLNPSVLILSLTVVWATLRVHTSLGQSHPVTPRHVLAISRIGAPHVSGFASIRTTKCGGSHGELITQIDTIMIVCRWYIQMFLCVMSWYGIN